MHWSFFVFFCHCLHAGGVAACNKEHFEIPEPVDVGHDASHKPPASQGWAGQLQPLRGGGLGSMTAKIIDHLIVNVCTRTWVIYCRKHCTFDRRRLVDRLSTETGSLCCRYCRRKKEVSGDHDYRWHWKLSGLGQLVGLRLSSCMLSIRSVTIPAILESRSIGSRRESLERQRERLKNLHAVTWG